MPPSEPPRSSRSKRVVRRAPKAPKPPNPHAQEQAYVSQGRAVQHAAQQQKRAAAKKAPAAAARVPGVAQAREQQQAVAKVPKAQQAKVARRVRARQQRTNLPEPGRTGGDFTAQSQVTAAQRAFDALNPENTVAKQAERAKPKETKRQANARLATAIIRPSSVAGAITAIGAASSAGYKNIHAPKIVQNAPKDIAEIAVTTPSSVAKLGDTAIHDPKKVPGMLVAPYKELAKHPGKFITEHPVSAALMVAPAVRVPGRAAGRVVRLTGKQTLERPAAVLPGSALKEARTGSRGAVTRTVQARKDAKGDAPVMTQAHVQRRVDEFYDFAKQQQHRVAASATRAAKRTADAKGLSKADRRVAVQENVKGARGGSGHDIRKRFAQEFGSPLVRTPEGQIVHPVHPEGPAHGALHDSQSDAQAITDHLNKQNIVIARGAHGLHQVTRRNSPASLQFKVHDAGYGKFAVVPKVAAERMNSHRAIGTSRAVGAKVLRTAGRSFRTAVLPFSMRWLFGQGGEAGVRAAVAGAGPADYVRFARVVKDMNRERPGSGDEFAMRVHGGQFDVTGTAREFADGRSLADEFKGTGLEDVAHGLTKAGSVKPIKAVRSGFAQYSNVVFNVVNGRIETVARKAMAGQAIRQGPLMERHMLGLTDKAIADAAKGLRGTEAQVQAARAVDRMYGQYQKFSPDKRETLLHTTPFYPWYRNVVTFLTQTLPVDHPVKAALVADLDAATEEWRKAHGLSLRQGGGKPGFLLGTYPVGNKGQVVPVGRYTPFAPGQPLQSVADLVTPQFGNVKEILKGVDWKGGKVKGNVPLVAAETLAEAHIPGYGQAGRITGLPGHYITKTGEPSIVQGKKVGPAIAREVNPLAKTKSRDNPGSGGSKAGGVAVKIKPVKVKPVKVKPVRVH